MLNRPLHLRNTPIFTEHILSQITQVCNHLEHPHEFTTVYLLAFFSFMRLSNIVPHNRPQYDHTRPSHYDHTLATGVIVTPRVTVH